MVKELSEFKCWGMHEDEEEDDEEEGDISLAAIKMGGSVGGKFMGITISPAPSHSPLVVHVIIYVAQTHLTDEISPVWDNCNGKRKRKGKAFVCKCKCKCNCNCNCTRYDCPLHLLYLMPLWNTEEGKCILTWMNPPEKK
ncbi:hypothetical protein SAY86_021196 [Trapa natans]|uniref:Uncharacterized protein n=1 Tax=Trapa natans TaxID=22666 RepID=A0AAN7M8A0_TRANT|nr:hypothetical protein SAY86_021196 [Trapa natans]